MRKKAVVELGFDDANPRAGSGRLAQTSFGLSYVLDEFAIVELDALVEIAPVLVFTVELLLIGIPKKSGAPIAYSYVTEETNTAAISTSAITTQR